MRKKSKKTHKALSLPEVMIAACILILVCSTLYLLFANCIILNQFNRERSQAMSHAEYVVEEIRDQSFSGLHAAIMTSNSWDWNSTQITSAGLEALNSESIDTTSDNTNPDLLDITVNVSWQDSRGRSSSVSLETLVADN